MEDRPQKYVSVVAVCWDVSPSKKQKYDNFGFGGIERPFWYDPVWYDPVCVPPRNTPDRSVGGSRPKLKNQNCTLSTRTIECHVWIVWTDSARSAAVADETRPIWVCTTITISTSTITIISSTSIIVNISLFNLDKMGSSPEARTCKGHLRSGPTVGFHNFNLRIFNLRVSNPNKWIVDVFWQDVGFQCARVSAQTNTMKFRKSTVGKGPGILRPPDLH